MIHSGLGGGSSMPQQQRPTQQLPDWRSMDLDFGAANLLPSWTGLPDTSELDFGVNIDWPTTITPGLPSDYGIGLKPPRPSQDWEGIAFLLLGLM